MNAAGPEPTPQLTVTQPRRIAAIALSIVPGLPVGAGMLVLGRFGRAVLWLALSCVALASMLLSVRAGLIAATVVFLGSLLDAALAPAPKDGLPETRRTVLVFVGFFLLGLAVRDGVSTRLVRPSGAFTASMEPALLQGERFMIDRRERTPRRGEIWFFDGMELEARPTDTVQRVVALAGDAIAIARGVVTVNGKPLATQESRCLSATPCSARLEDHGGIESLAELRGDPGAPCGKDLAADSCPKGMPPRDGGCVVPAGHVFVLGDNRCAADDSRRYGPVPVSALLGRGLEIYFSRGPQGLRWDRLGVKLSP